MTSLCIAILASVKEGNLYVNKMNYYCTIFGFKQLGGQPGRSERICHYSFWVRIMKEEGNQQHSDSSGSARFKKE